MHHFEIFEILKFWNFEILNIWIFEILNVRDISEMDAYPKYSSEHIKRLCNYCLAKCSVNTCWQSKNINSPGVHCSLNTCWNLGIVERDYERLPIRGRRAIEESSVWEVREESNKSLDVKIEKCMPKTQHKSIVHCGHVCATSLNSRGFCKYHFDYRAKAWVLHVPWPCKYCNGIPTIFLQCWILHKSYHPPTLYHLHAFVITKL